MAHTEIHSAAPQDEPRPVAAGEVWRLIAPGLGYVFLAAAAILGLFTASGATDSGTYYSGLATFALAVIIAAVRMKLQLDGRETGFLLPVTAASSDALVVTIALLAVLGLFGVVLAASVGGDVYSIGLALFVISAALIFLEMKRYFDRADAGH